MELSIFIWSKYKIIVNELLLLHKLYDMKYLENKLSEICPQQNPTILNCLSQGSVAFILHCFFYVKHDI